MNKVVIGCALFVCGVALVSGPTGAVPRAADPVASVIIQRLSGNPMITPATDPSIGTNINGPSLIRVPKWVSKPLGSYYLYFADHNGKYIRLAYSNRLQGPWKIYVPGTLSLSHSFFTNHIASPDVVVDDTNKQILMYYHGLTAEERMQHTRVAVSTDGLHFTGIKVPVGRGSAYWRLFRYDGWWYALAMPGKLFRSRDGVTSFEAGPQLFPDSFMQVHNAVLLSGDTLKVFYTRRGDSPERIVASTVKLGPDWNQWSPTPAVEILRPEARWEGANLPLTEARIGALDHPEHAVRDPAIYTESGKTYIVYAIAGESGLAIAKVLFP